MKGLSMNMKGLFFLAASLGMMQVSVAKTYYVAPDGDDSKDGLSVSAAFKSVQKAADAMNTGDSAVLSAGIYKVSERIILSKVGTPGSRLFLGTRGTDRAKLDFSSQVKGDNSQGIWLTGNYWTIKGLQVHAAGDNGILIENPKDPIDDTKYLTNQGSYNTIEWCVIDSCNDAGLQLKRYAAHNNIINCDSYHNWDEKTDGGNADGFAPKLTVGTDNYFYGCRAWENSDDGWDSYIKEEASIVPTIITEYCICYRNGYKYGQGESGNGNGFKMGSDEYKSKFIARHCLSVNNLAKGFDQNHNAGEMTMINCTAWGNLKSEFYFKEASDALTIKNCIGIGARLNKDLITSGTFESNVWEASITASEFESNNISDILAPRNSDGTLSVKTLSFLKPKTGSKYVNKGMNAGLAFSSTAPDLGWIEVGLDPSPDKSRYTTAARQSFRTVSKSGELIGGAYTVLPNITKVNFIAPSAGHLSIRMYNLAGKTVADFGSRHFNAGQNSQLINLNKYNSGMYVCELSYSGSDGIKTDRLKLVKN